jgi:hypothetical protein
MTLNPMILPTAFLAGLAFWGGASVMKRAGGTRARLALIAAGVVLAVPGVLLAIYYLHVLDRAAWFYRLRALPGSELAAPLAGLLAGTLWSLPALRQKGPARLVTRCALPALLALGLALPYAKPVLDPLKWPDRPRIWRDGVCLQSTGATCGPSSAATLLRALGLPGGERELAGECYSSASGTECWYLARALRRRGLEVEFRVGPPEPETLPCPAIAGVCLGGPKGVGHFVAVLSGGPEGFTIGDPAVGLLRPGNEARTRGLWFTGFFMVVQKPAAPGMAGVAD